MSLTNINFEDIFDTLENECNEDKTQHLNRQY